MGRACKCVDFKIAQKTIDSALALAISHGMKGLHKSFIMCPYCAGRIDNSKIPKGFKEGICKCGNKYLYVGLDMKLCVKCLDACEVESAP